MSADLVAFVEQLYNAFALAGVYMLIALGITLVFGLTGILFFAQGELVTAGAFATLLLVEAGLPFVVALVMAALLVGLFSEVVIDRGLMRRTLVRPLTGFLVSLGLQICIQGVMASWFSDDFYFIDPPFRGTWQFGNLTFNQERAFVSAVAIFLGVLVFISLERTHYGRGIRALAEDRLGAQVLGVQVGRLISVVFFAGTALAGAAGGLLGTVFPFSAFFGGSFLLKGFAVAILGGMGNVRGVVVASVLLATGETLGAAYLSLEWANAISLVVLVAILMFRPQGLFRGVEHRALASPAAGLIRETAHLRVTGRGLGGMLVNLPRLAPVLLLIIGVLLPLVLPTNRSLLIGIFALVNSIAAYTLWFALRQAGIFSLAQSAFVGIGAYVTALTVLQFELNFWFQVPLAIIAAAFVAALFGTIALRTTGSFFFILLFFLADLLVVVLTNLRTITGGIQGLVVATAPQPLGELVDFGELRPMYYLVLAALVLVILLFWSLSRSVFGNRLSAIRDNEILARSIGLDTTRYKLITITLVGAVAGFGGVFYTYSLSGIEPSYFGSAATITLMLQMFLGGTGSIVGPVIGAVTAAYLPEILRLSPYQAQIAYGLILVAIILVMPSGIAGETSQRYAQLIGRFLTRTKNVGARDVRAA